MSGRRDNATVIGVSATACAACCAGPILGILATIGLTTAAGIAVFGIAAVAIAALAIPAVIRHQRRRATATCAPPTEPIEVTISTPTLRPRQPQP